MKARLLGGACAALMLLQRLLLAMPAHAGGKGHDDDHRGDHGRAKVLSDWEVLAYTGRTMRIGSSNRPRGAVRFVERALW